MRAAQHTQYIHSRSYKTPHKHSHTYRHIGLVVHMAHIGIGAVITKQRSLRAIVERPLSGASGKNQGGVELLTGVSCENITLLVSGNRKKRGEEI